MAKKTTRSPRNVGEKAFKVDGNMLREAHLRQMTAQFRVLGNQIQDLVRTVKSLQKMHESAAKMVKSGK